MNTANLQLEGLCLAVAMINKALVDKNLLTREEIDATLQAAEDVADRDRQDTISSSNRDAVGFPIRLSRQANSASAGEGQLNFSELTRMVAERDGTTS